MPIKCYFSITEVLVMFQISFYFDFAFAFFVYFSLLFFIIYIVLLNSLCHISV